MNTVVKRCRCEKKEEKEESLMNPESEFPACPEFEVKSKRGKLFMNEKIFEEYSVKIYEIDPFFMSIAKKR